MPFIFTLVDNNNTKWLAYMGKNQYENDILLQNGLPHDIWFHAHGRSSAHVYLECLPEFTISSIPQEILSQCCQLTKYNSISGKKEPSISIVYTTWDNVIQFPTFKPGQVTFYNLMKLRYYDIQEDKALGRRLMKHKHNSEEISLQWAQERRQAFLQASIGAGTSSSDKSLASGTAAIQHKKWYLSQPFLIGVVGIISVVSISAYALSYFSSIK